MQLLGYVLTLCVSNIVNLILFIMSDNTTMLTGKERDEYIAKHFNDSDVATRQERLSGNDLLDYIKATNELTHKQRCLGAGYIQDTKYDDGTDKPAFTDFFEAILDAKKEFDDNTKEIYANLAEDSMNRADWYDSLTDERRELFDMIEDRCLEFRNPPVFLTGKTLDAEQCQEFMDKLDDLGITTADEFESAYMYQSDSWNAEREFAQFFAEEIACLNDAGMGSFLVIDWQATWDCNLSYDFNTIQFDGETYFFQNL